jgi:hypothetical protein
MNNAIHVAYTPDKLRFEHEPGKWLEFDIIEAELTLESFTKEDPEAIPTLKKIQEWVQAELSTTLTTTQAWSLWGAIRSAYEAHKKKFTRTLTSAIVSASIPSNSPLLKPSPSNELSPVSEP